MPEVDNNQAADHQPIEPAAKGKNKVERVHCGVIMPISGSPDYPASHWSEMLKLISQAAHDAKFTCDLVSATGRDDIIHSSIVTNIYENEIVVCDVSSRNPNVMLELGLRLASKLPVVVIFDEQGNYPFDINNIRYLEYRKDMRYYDTEEFKKKLTAKLLEVHDTYKKGKYKSFLSQFKNIDFNLDNISTETQTLKQFLENIDKRLSNIENKTQRVDSSKKNSSVIVDTTAVASTVVNFIEEVATSKKFVAPINIEEAGVLYAAVKSKFPYAFNKTPEGELKEIIVAVANRYLSSIGREELPF